MDSQTKRQFQSTTKRQKAILQKEADQLNHQAKIGKCLAQLLILKKTKEHKDRYHTAWGTKTDLGLYLCVKRVIDDERINI